MSKRIFKFLSSVRLAVPLMLILLVSCAVGTVVESRYDSKIATILIYRSWWFELLLCGLWVNIFCSTISRYPFKKHHTGFVITHIGLLTLLVGSLITAETGVDGDLRVEQGRSDNRVFVSRIVLQTRDSKGTLVREVPVSRSLSPLSMNQLSSLNEKLGSNLLLESYAPFVNIQSGIQSDPLQAGPPAVRFRLKSQFFDVTESLQVSDRPEMQMGPALFRISSKAPELEKSASPKTKVLKAEAESIRVLNSKSGEALGNISLKDLKKGPQQLKVFRIGLVQKFEEAVVAGGKLSEQGTPGKNPAVELSIEHQNQKAREVIFAKFPGFSLNPDGVFGLKFEWISSGTAPEPVSAPQGMPGGNLVEFSPSRTAGTNNDSVHVRLSKGGKVVLEQDAKSGETIQTPWMGMQLTIESWIPHAISAESVQPTELQERSNIPPSAVRMRSLASQNSEPFWMVEGSSRTIPSNGEPLEVYYGPRAIELPFSIQLEKFTKADYPGTETAMSYESQVRVDGSGESIRIAMNEPLKRSGYTLYQSSYILEPGQPPISIFSVNKDPGRPIKYAGSLTLVIGIAVFTVMRSRWYQNRKKGQLA